jgi:DNA-binding MarR family transcriptional regulator
MQFDDARATWDLLTPDERRVLDAIGRRWGIGGPQGIAGQMGMSWQRVSRHARQLKVFKLVSIKSMPKQVSYELTGQGEACLAAGKAEDVHLPDSLTPAEPGVIQEPG